MLVRYFPMSEPHKLHVYNDHPNENTNGHFKEVGWVYIE